MRLGLHNHLNAPSIAQTPFVEQLILIPPETLVFGAKLYLLAFIFPFFLRDLRASSADRREILLRDRKRVRLYNLGSKFREAFFRKILRAKTCKISLDFGRLQTSAANISRTDEDIRNRTSTRSTAISLAFAEESRPMANFDQVTMDIFFHRISEVVRPIIVIFFAP